MEVVEDLFVRSKAADIAGHNLQHFGTFKSEKTARYYSGHSSWFVQLKSGSVLGTVLNQRERILPSGMFLIETVLEIVRHS